MFNYIYYLYYYILILLQLYYILVFFTYCFCLIFFCNFLNCNIKFESDRFVVYINTFSKCSVIQSNPLVLLEDSYHPELEICVEIIRNVQDSNHQTSSLCTRFNFAKANCKKSSRELSTITWPDYNGDIEFIASHFNNIITKLFEKYYPIESVCGFGKSYIY